MTDIQRVESEQAAARLAGLLNGDTRRRPIAVVTTPSSRAEPWIDVQELAREAGGLADVYLMATGGPSWEFSRLMAEGTQVYGGAGRVYPVGHEWASDLGKSPLRFAFNEKDGERATDLLISDMLRMAAASGLMQVAPSRSRHLVTGRVRAVVAGRALVDIGTAMPATIAEELTVEDVSISRMVDVDQRIEGILDRETARIDVTGNLRDPSEALGSYALDDVILAKVAMVRAGKAELVLYPKTTAPAISAHVLRADVTANDLDDLRTLMTVGETVRARVTDLGPQWKLRLDDIDDDEPTVAAPSLLPGGPPWLVEEPDALDIDESDPLPPPIQRSPVPDADVQPAVPPSVDEASHVFVASSVPSRPTPAIMDGKRTKPAAAPAAQTDPLPAQAQPETTKGLLLKIDGLRAELGLAMTEIAELQRQLLAGQDEREQIRFLLDREENRANKAENESKALRSRLRRAVSRKSGPSTQAAPQFADAEHGFRYLVLTQWATRTLPDEQADRPLPDYHLGPQFLSSLARLEGIKEEKVADVVFEILTGVAASNPSRELHRLRTGPGGDDPPRTRGDGAVAWRASLQVRTPSARRIHYWVLPAGLIELARVTTHDDFSA